MHPVHNQIQQTALTQQAVQAKRTSSTGHRTGTSHQQPGTFIDVLFRTPGFVTTPPGLSRLPCAGDAIARKGRRASPVPGTINAASQSVQGQGTTASGNAASGSIRQHPNRLITHQRIGIIRRRQTHADLGISRHGRDQSNFINLLFGHADLRQRLELHHTFLN